LSHDDFGEAGGFIVLRYFALGACAFLLVACATITKGTTQVVAIDTPCVPSATCTITTQSGPQVVTTPGTVTLKKGSDPLPIACVKDCYVNGQSIIPSGAEAMAAGNVIFGGLIGLGVDAASGALTRHDHGRDVARSVMSPPAASTAAAYFVGAIVMCQLAT
jgi:hypothetical protein